MKTCVYIPAWNVREEVAGVLERLPMPFARTCAEVLVIDNASSDGTPDVCSRLARSLPYPLTVYRNARNVGYGGSQKMAYAHAIRQGYDAVVMLHGDGQYPPQHVPRLVQTLLDTGAGLAYGSRLLATEEKDQTPFARRMGVRVLSALQNLTAGLWLAEWYSGYRVFRCSALARVPFQACDDDYYFDVQIILLLSMAGYPIAELPVAKRYEGNPSPVNIYQFGRKVLAHLLHYPLARWGIVPGEIYRRSAWEQLSRRPVPELRPYPLLAAG
jgi:glycosyltransferase involved in cell wall biosynthesis